MREATPPRRVSTKKDTPPARNAREAPTREETRFRMPSKARFGGTRFGGTHPGGVARPASETTRHATSARTPPE